MEKVTVISGVAAPLPIVIGDTVVFIRIEHLSRSPREELGRWGFAARRFLPDGSEDPGFILNRAGWRDAPILVAGRNFGCGSSREHAVWALLGMGLRCVIAPSFGDIFRSNCFQNGLLPVTLPEATVHALFTALGGSQPASARTITVSLVDCTVEAPDGERLPFEIEARRREALLLGLDEIGQTLAMADRIDAWQAGDRQRRPWVWQVGQMGQAGQEP